MNELPGTETPRPDNWTLLRDVGVLQVKLVVDGLRDLVLVPASLVAGVISLLSGGDGKPGPQFYQLLGIGKQSERWINLFGAFRNAPEEVRQSQQANLRDIDSIVGQVEKFVVDEYRRGGVTAQAKEQIDKALDAVQRRARRGGN